MKEENKAVIAGGIVVIIVFICWLLAWLLPIAAILLLIKWLFF